MGKEIWKDIKGYEGFYQASTKGRIRTLTRRVGPYQQTHHGKVLKPKRNNIDGYARVSFSKYGITKDTTYHRVIAETFIPNPENKEQVNHINGIKDDNRVENLEWMTPGENTNHGFDITDVSICNKTKVTNKETGEVRWFRSTRQASIEMATSHHSLATIKHRLQTNKFEYKNYIIEVEDKKEKEND